MIYVITEKIFMRMIFLLIAFLSTSLFSQENEKPLKVLHLSFHIGCLNEFSSVAKELGLDLSSWHIPSLPPYFFDGVSTGNVLYTIDRLRAERVWKKHKSFFEQFDVIVTSDTAPLSRIFLQNNFQKRLVIWVCNRFDYHDAKTADAHFPDQEYYDLLRMAMKKKNMTIVANSRLEHIYAQSKGVDTGTLVIKPCCARARKNEPSNFPHNIQKHTTFFLPHYHNELNFMDLQSHLRTLGIASYCSTYNGGELQDFKGIIHLPYAWSTLALFENMQYGIPYFIPSESFFKKLLKKSSYWHQNRELLLEKDHIQASEWYCKEMKPIFIYFDSWEDLKRKVQNTNYAQKRTQIAAFAKQHKQTMLLRWKEVFDRHEY